MTTKNYLISLIAYIITLGMHVFFTLNPLNNFTDGLLAGGFFAAEIIWITRAWQSKPKYEYISVFAITAFLFEQIGIYYNIRFIQEITMYNVTIIIFCMIFKIIIDAEKKDIPSTCPLIINPDYDPIKSSQECKIEKCPEYEICVAKTRQCQ